MGRAPNSGAPQRVSAHVVPKAPSEPSASPSAFGPAEDEDDKTTIESGWEDEASTTVEQGEVAAKIRALGLGSEAKRSGTNITSTDGGELVEELTVDEPAAAARAQAAQPAGRLIITAGNDAGKALEVRPGKTYTIGRGIDNDLVLTDIAVSRKHFDVRHDNGAWVLADRGSGNGTLINTRIEDAPFMLASGDVIEIGNTAFRFELPEGAPRSAPGAGAISDEELEMSTVSGKPYRELEVATPGEAASPLLPVAAPSAAAPGPALSATAPLPRPRAATGRPAPGYALDRPGSRALSQGLASQTTQPPLPGVAMSGPAVIPLGPLGPLGASSAPLSASHILHAAQPLPTLAPLGGRPATAIPTSGLHEAPSGAMSTLPGVQAAPLSPRSARLPFSGYPAGQPGTAEFPTQRASNPSRASMPPGTSGAQPGRDPTSTAQVQPMLYAASGPVQPQPPPQPPYQPSPISRQTRMAIAGVGLAVFAAVATIAIIKGARGSSPAAVPVAQPPARNPSLDPLDTQPRATTQPPQPRTQPAPARPTKPTVTPIAPAVTAPPPARVAPTAAQTPTATPPPPRTTPAPVVAVAPAPQAGVQTPPPPTTARVAVATTTAPATTSQPAPPAPPVPTPPATTSPPAVAPRVATPPATTTATTAAARPTAPAVTPPPASPRPVARDDKKPVAKRPDKRPDKKPARGDVMATTAEPARPDKKRGRSTQDVKSEASALYRNKNFAGAASAISAALPGFSGGEAQELRSTAALYSQLGKTYSVGMAPGTKPTEAFQALRRAVSYDRELGAAYTAELQERLGSVAHRAAVSFMAAKEYEQAFQAVRSSESLGNTSSSNKAVRDRLESLANDLYRTAQGELASDAEGARKKLRQILGLVDAKHPVYARAQKLLNAP